MLLIVDREQDPLVHDVISAQAHDSLADFNPRAQH